MIDSGVFSRTVANDATLNLRISALEGKYVDFTFWEEISSGTSGTLTKPAGSEIILDQWPGDIDAVVSIVATGKVPDEEYAYTSAGAIVTTTLTAAGAWSLSAAPSSYPVAIIYRGRIPLSALTGTEEFLDFTKVDDGLDGINYANPISANSTGTIIPAAGSYYTSTSKLVTLTSTSGTAKFQPGVDTSRIIWGTGASAAATLTINPTNLVAGNTFAIDLEGGESRILKYDGTDFVKIGGIEIPTPFKAYNSSDQTGLTHATYNTVSLDTVTYDPASIFSSGAFTPIRNALWSIKARASTDPLITETIIRSIPRLRVANVNDEAFADVSPDAAQVVGTPNRVTGTVDKYLTAGVAYDLAIFARTNLGGNWSILGDGETLAASMSGMEEVPW